MNEQFTKHGAVSWTELSTSDVESAKKFYTQLFDWKFQEMSMPDFTYNVIEVDGKGIGGIMKNHCADNSPSHWMTYITVTNVDESAKSAEELGGKITLPPTDIPNVGRFSILQDPQGAHIAIITYLKK